ncbi:MAG: hypothetical protein HS123_23555 [Solibacteraceae bacterium]|nr:hypothetical protein [Solibacteraceae bacterium]
MNTPFQKVAKRNRRKITSLAPPLPAALSTTPLNANPATPYSQAKPCPLNAFGSTTTIKNFINTRNAKTTALSLQPKPIEKARIKLRSPRLAKPNGKTPSLMRHSRSQIAKRQSHHPTATAKTLKQ